MITSPTAAELRRNYAEVRLRLLGPLPPAPKPVMRAVPPPPEPPPPPPPPPPASPLYGIREVLRQCAPITPVNLRCAHGNAVKDSPLTSAKIISIVADLYGVSRDDLIGPSRQHVHLVPRQIAMALAVTGYRLSLPAVGRHFRRDHSTVVCAVRKYGPVIEQILGETGS